VSDVSRADRCLRSPLAEPLADFLPDALADGDSDGDRNGEKLAEGTPKDDLEPGSPCALKAGTGRTGERFSTREGLAGVEGDDSRVGWGPEVASPCE
jgi:hypothetical protein